MKLRILTGLTIWTLFLTFSCEDPAEQSLDITFTSPISSTIWTHNVPVTISWADATGSQIVFYLLKGGDSLDVCQNWTTNDGEAGFNVLPAWGTGNDYQIRAVDSDGNEGISEEFQIQS